MFNPLIGRIQKKRMYTPLLFIIDEYKNNSLFKNPTQVRTDEKKMFLSRLFLYFDLKIKDLFLKIKAGCSPSVGLDYIIEWISQ